MPVMVESASRRNNGDGNGIQDFRAQTKATEEDGVIEAYIPLSTPVWTEMRNQSCDGVQENPPYLYEAARVAVLHTYNTLTNQIGEFTKLRITMTA